MKRKHSKKRGLDEGGSNHSQTGGGGNENGRNHFQDTKVTINEGNSTSLFQFACDTHGKEVVQGIVDDLFYVQMKKDVGFTRRALLRAVEMVEIHYCCEVFKVFVILTFCFHEI